MRRWAHENPAVFGYLLGATIFGAALVGLFYQQSFAARADNIVNCEKRNDQIREVNRRAPVIRKLIRVEILEVRDGEQMGPETRGAHLALVDTAVSRVSLNDCGALFGKPWPFG